MGDTIEGKDAALSGSPAMPDLGGEVQWSTPCIRFLAAFHEFQSELRTIPKLTNAHRYQYADLATVREATREPLSNAGLSVIQPAPFVRGSLHVHTVVMHSASGQWMAISEQWECNSQDPQAIGSLETYARRYGYMSALNLYAKESDDDGEAARASLAKAPASKGPVPNRPEYRKVEPTPAAKPPRPAWMEDYEVKTEHDVLSDADMCSSLAELGHFFLLLGASGLPAKEPSKWHKVMQGLDLRYKTLVSQGCAKSERMEERFKASLDLAEKRDLESQGQETFGGGSNDEGNRAEPADGGGAESGPHPDGSDPEGQPSPAGAGADPPQDNAGDGSGSNPYA